MKKILLILLLLRISLAFAMPVAAAERTYTYEPQQENRTGEAAELLEKALPESMSGVADMAKDTVINGGNGGLDGRFILSELIKTVKNEITGPLQVFFSLIFLVVAAAVFKTLSAAVKSGGVASAFTLCSSLCFCVAVLFPLERVMDSGAALIEEINALQIEGMPRVESLNALVGGYINLEYRLPNGKTVKFLEDGATYLGTQLECEFGGDRCFGIAANMDFILVCTYEEKGANPELVLYKKR